MLAEAEVFKGDQFVRHGPGRPKAEVTKEKSACGSIRTCWCGRVKAARMALADQ